MRMLVIKHQVSDFITEPVRALSGELINEIRALSFGLKPELG
jgi:hypothetical protein